MSSVIGTNISKRSLFLLVSDLGAIAFSYSAAVFLRFGNFVLSHEQFPPYLYFAYLVFPLIFYISDLYYPFKYFYRTQTFVDILIGVTIGAVLLAAAAFLDRTLIISRSILLLMAAVLIPSVFLIRLLYDSLFKSRFLDKKALIIGAGAFAREIAGMIKGTPHAGLEIVGFVQEGGKGGQKSLNGVPIVGRIENLLSLIDWYHAGLVILALDPREEISEYQVMSQLLRRQVAVTSAIHLYEKLREEVPYQLLGDHYLLGLMSQIRLKPYLKLKSFLDSVIALFLLIVLGPVLLTAILMTGLTRQGKIFFIQKRVGKGGKLFNLIKLKTMTDVRKGRQKITRFGAWLRKYRIDEIPQLINVIRGDMSLIGPRPEIPYFVERSRKKIPFYDAVFAVKPGLTGWAQVKFRHATSVKDYNQKFRYNLYYLKNLSFTFDFVIFLRTIRVILLGKGK